MNEAVKYAYPITIKQLIYAHNFISDTLELSIYDTSPKEGRYKIEQAKKRIIDWVRENHGSTKTQFRMFAQKNKLYFAVGELLAMKILNQLIRDKEISIERGERNTVYLNSKES